MHNLSASENSGGDDFLDMSSHLAKVDKRIVFTETRSTTSRKSSTSSSNVVVSASINIKNISGDSERIIYKVKNTSTDSFKVFPIIGTLKKGESEKIKITVKPNFPKSLISYEHFQVQVMPFPSDYVPNLKGGDGNKNTHNNNVSLQDSLDKSNNSTTGTGIGTGVETLHVNVNNLETSSTCQNDASSSTPSVETLKLIWLKILHKQVAVEKHYINCHYLNASIALDHSKSKSNKNPDVEGIELNKHKLSPEFDTNNTQSTHNTNNNNNSNSNSSKHKRKLSMTSDHKRGSESPRKNNDTSCYIKNIDDGIRNRHFPQGAQKPLKVGGGRRQPDDPRLNNNNMHSTRIRPLNQDENGNDIIDFDKDLFSFSGNLLGRNTVEPNPNDWNADDDDDDRKELFFHSMETYGWHRFVFVMAIVLFMLFLMALGVVKEHIPPPPPPPTFTIQQDNNAVEEEDTFPTMEEGTTLEIIRSYAFRWLHDPRLSLKLF